MPVSWRTLTAGTQTVATGNTTSGQVTFPSDLLGGDTCYLVVNFNPTTGSPTTGLGAWTQVGSDIIFNANHHGQLWKKTAAGTTGAASSDASTVVTIGGYGTQRISAALVCGRTDGTEDIASSVSGTESLSPSGNTPTVTVSDVNGADTLAFVMQRSSTPSTSITNSSGLTSVYSVGTGSGACSMAVGFKATGTANGGTQPATTWSQSPNSQTGWILLSMAVGIAPNTAPVANAGTDQSVGVSSLVTLNGSGSSDADGDALTYAWTKTSGPAVTLSSSTAQNPTFTSSSSSTTYVFSLVVTDSHGSSSSADTVTITVNSAAPMWRGLAAGAQTFATGNTTSGQVTLPADLKGGDTCYLAFNFNPATGTPSTGLSGWTQVGSDVVFGSTHHAQLWKKTAAGTTGLASSDAGTTVTIGGYGTQRIAGAVACGRSDGTEDVATLANGTDTTPFNAPAVTVSDSHGASNLTFVMQRSSTPSTSITNSSGLTSVYSVGSGSGACSIAVGVGNAVTADAGTQAATTWAQSPNNQVGWIQISLAVGVKPNSAPTSSAGPDQSVGQGSVCTLDGSGSFDPDGDTITYAWTKTSGPAATLSSSTAQKPTFTPGSTGTYVFSLVVTDSQASASSADTVSIVVTSSPPTADAGPDQSDVVPYSAITLDGTASSDAGGSIVSYAWVQTAGATATLTGAATASPTFLAPGTVAGSTLTFRLTVTDNSGITATDTVNVVVLPHTLFRLGSGGPEPVRFVPL